MMVVIKIHIFNFLYISLLNSYFKKNQSAKVIETWFISKGFEILKLK